MSITGKIVLPFALLFVIAIAASSWAAVRQATLGVEHRLERMTRDLAAIASQGGFLLSRPFLLRIKSVYRAEAAATQGEPPRVDASTFPEGVREQVEQAVRAVAADPAASAGLRDPVAVAGEEYVLAWSRVTPRSEPAPQSLFLFFPAADITAEKRGAALPLVAVGVVGAVLVSILGYAVARSITSPLRLLAEKTREIAAGSRDPSVDVHTRDELESLARAFETMARSLREREQELVRAEQLATLGKVTARIAHEIRNPLAAMKMTVQILRKEEPEGPGRQDLDRILSEVDRLQITVDELLGWAAPVDLQRLPADLNAVVADTLALLERQIAHRNVKLDLRPGPLPPVPLDANRFKQVVLNLVLNALEAMPGGGTLEVRTRADDAARAAVLEVWDTGAGIPPEIEARAFEPFVSSRPQGTGLGLAVSRAIVEKHGGTLAYARRENRTVFEARWPLAGGPEAARPGA